MRRPRETSPLRAPRFAGRCLALTLLVVVSSVGAPAAWAVREDAQLWTGANASIGLTDSIRAGLLIQTRLRDDMSTLERVLLRPSLSWRLRSWVALGVGYDAHLIQSPLDVEEQRVWQEALLDHGLGRLAVTHRLRLEERWGDPIDGMSVRLRYLLGLASPELVWGLRGVIRDEIFLNFDADGPTRHTGLGENRAFAGLRRGFAERYTVEIGYQAQLIRPRLAQDLLNHTLLVGVAARF